MSARSVLLFRGSPSLRVYPTPTATGLPSTTRKFLVLDGIVLLVAYNRTDYQRSADGGASYTTPSAFPYAVVCAAVANGRFVIFCSDGTNHRVLHGTDGSTWTTVTPTQPIVCITGRDLIWNGSNYVCYAATNDANVRRVFATSSDLTTWTLSTSGVNDSSYWEVVPYAGGFMGRQNLTYTPLGTDGVTEGTPYTPASAIATPIFKAPYTTMFSRGGKLYAMTDTQVISTFDGVTWDTYFHFIAAAAFFYFAFLPVGDKDVLFYAGSGSGSIQVREARAGSGGFTDPGISSPGAFNGAAVQGFIAHVYCSQFVTGDWTRYINA